MQVFAFSLFFKTVSSTCKVNSIIVGIWIPYIQKLEFPVSGFWTARWSHDWSDHSKTGLELEWHLNTRQIICHWDHLSGLTEKSVKIPNKRVSSKYWRSGVPTRGSSSRGIPKLCNQSRVEAKSLNCWIKVELLNREPNIELNTDLSAKFFSIKVEFLLESCNKSLCLDQRLKTFKWLLVRIRSIL